MDVRLSKIIIKRAKLWQKIAQLVKEEGVPSRHRKDDSVLVLEAVTQAFAAARICRMEGIVVEECDEQS